MVPLPEFIGRLVSSRCVDTNFRACDNLIESKKAEAMQEEIEQDICMRKRIHPTYWKEITTIVHEAD